MRTLLLFCCTCAVFPAAAAEPPEPGIQFSEENGVDAATLDTIRGGFSYGDNLLVTLGIDRLVRINGNAVEQSSVQFGDVGKLASGATQLSADAIQGTRLIQNGQAGQMVSTLANGALAGTVIQNTLNDQLISSQTTIRASVNNAGLVQGMNFGATLNQALLNAVTK
jgi:hypothetical protein